MRSASLLLAIGSAAALLVAVVTAAPPSPPSPPLQAVAGPVAVVVDPPKPGATPAEPPTDPFPLRRQFLTDDQLDRLTTDPRGPFRKLTKPDFEAKVRAAADAQQLARTPPLVVIAAYRGRYESGKLSGSADWTVANPAGKPGLIPLDSLRLAVTDLTSAADRTALLFRGKPGGKELPGTFLWVGGERETAVALGWSARGVEEADEEKFDLGLLAAAVATLEIALPADRLPTLTNTAGTRRLEATGPFPGKSDGERVWKWAVGGMSGVVLAVRPAFTPGAVVVASRAVGFDLSPAEVKATFDFTLDSPRGLIREQTFATDAGVKVTSVSGDGVEKWQQDPADGKTAGKLTVAWREPMAMAKVRMVSTIPLASGAVTWACPSVWATGTLPGADVIDVILASELKLDGWSAGDYRSTMSTPAKGLKIQFTGTLAAGPDNTRRPPAIRIRSAEPEIATDEALTWRVESGRTRLSALMKVRVVRGPLPQLVVHTAAGYVLESASLVPEDPAVTFGPLPGTPNAWVVEPSRAVPTGRTLEVKLEFRGPPGPPAPDAGDPSPAPIAVPFPLFVPARAVERQGTLSASGDGVTVAARTVLPLTTDAGGWVVKYRGKEPGGVGLFAAEPTEVSVDMVRLAVRNKVCEATIVGRADDGPVGSLTVFVPHLEGQVRAGDGATAVPMPVARVAPLLSAANGWTAVGTAATIPDGMYWRITFAKPKTGPFEFTVSYPVPPVDPSAPLVLPLPDVGGGRGDVTTELSAELSPLYRAVEIASNTFPPHVRLEPLSVKSSGPAGSGEWRLLDVQQINQIDGDGGLSVTLSGRVEQAAGRALDIALPVAAVVESIQVGGKWVTVKAGDVVRLPLPEIPSSGVTFELRYRLPAPPLGPLPTYTSPIPGLPDETSVASRWVFARGWLPWPSLSDADDCPKQAEVRVARSPVLRGVGFGLAGLVLALGVRLVWKDSRWRVLLMALVVAGCGVCVWVGPIGWLKLLQPSLYVGLAVLVIVAFRQFPPSIRRPSTIVKSAAAIALIATLVQAQPTGEPAVVYVVGADAQAVYAPQSVLDKLDTLAAPQLPEVIITRSTYTATADDTAVTFDATFTLECPRDGDHPFTLPLAGVRLEAMQLDGKDPFPDASKPDRYSLTVKGKGKHTLTARFAVMPTTTGGDREARFGAPEVHACQVTFTVGAKGRQPDVSTRRGGQTVTEAGGRWTATADHGAGRQVAVRWREATADGGEKPTISVKEAGVWDVTDSYDAGVWTAFAYTVAGGGVGRLEIDIPPGLVATKLLVRPTDPRANPVGVRGWRIGPNADGTRVVARLQQPTDGRVLVLVRAVPDKPLGPNPVLRFPRPVGIPDADRDSVYAVRFTGVVDGGVNRVGAIDFPADAIVKDFPSVPEFGFDKSLPARVVKRDPNATAELRPTLAPTRAFTPLGMEVVFTCGAWAEVEGVVRVGVKDAGFAEFTVPDGIDVRDVRAAGQIGWGRSGNKVQVWLKPTAAEVLVQWSGSVPTAGELPLPRWSTAVNPFEPTIVRVRPADGYSVQPVATAGPKPKPGVDGEWVYTVEGNSPPIRVDVRPVEPVTPKPADVPTVKPSPAAVPHPTPEMTVSPVSPVTAGVNWWLLVAAVAWGVGLLAAVILLRGSRWQPERVAAVGAFGLLAAGVSSPLGWAFATVAGIGVLWRLVRVVRQLM